MTAEETAELLLPVVDAGGGLATAAASAAAFASLRFSAVASRALLAAASCDSSRGPGRGAPTQAEAAFERTDGIVRFKLGPATFTAGITEPSLSVLTEFEWAGPL